MIGALTNHLWQSTLFGLAAGLVAVALRRNRASIRHAVWMIASLKFLIPFSLLIALGARLAPLPAPQRPDVAAPATWSIALDRIAQPFSIEDVAPPSSTPVQTTSWMPALAVAIWMLGVCAIGVARVRHWRRVRAAVRASVPMTLSPALDRAGVPARSTPDRLEPGVVGIIRPLLLMPAGIEQRLTLAQLDAIVAHELCHVRRRDNLTAAMHMVVESLVWFHPLVWWIGARLMRERERACDEHVLRELGAPQAYAEGIVNVCKLYVESPIACVSGVTGSDLRARLDAITMNLVGVGLTRARKALLASAAALAIALPMAFGMMTAPLHASSAGGQAPSSAPAPQTFEVASIKPCDADSQPAVPGGRTGGGGGSFSPGRATLTCFVVRNLIEMAYVNNRDSRDPKEPLFAWAGRIGGGRTGGPQRIRGGPDWVYADKYTIEAKAGGLDPTDGRNPDRIRMLGPMLRALLEERFHLKVHEAVEEVPMFAMTVAKGGLKITPMKEGGCTNDRSNGPIVLSDALARGVLPTCGTVNGGPHGPNWRYEHGGQDLAVVARMVGSDLGINVIDRTGITDKFNILWEYLPDENTPGSLQWLDTYGRDPANLPPAATVFKALEEQLGLKLEKIKGPRGYVVIDHIERPTPDGPVFLAPPARAQGPAHSK